MVKFGKKFFFSELPEVEEKKSKKEKVKKEKKRKKVKKPRKKINIKAKISSIIEIIINTFKKIWPILALIVIILLLVLGIHACSKNIKKKSKNDTPKQQTVKADIIKEIRISIFDEVPSIDKFVSNIEKFKDVENSISYDKDKLIDNHYEETGEYEVIIKINDKSYKSKIIVEDITPPELELKGVIITEGQTYSIKDFINKCADNSKKECSIKFTEDKYVSITAPGTYEIKITATDANNNSVEKITSLTINKKPEPQPTPDPIPTPQPDNKCKFGDGTYNKNITLTYNITKNNCAQDPSLAYVNNSYINKAEKMGVDEEKKLREDLQKKKLNVVINLQWDAYPVFNSSNKGLVGYTVRFFLTSGNKKTEYSIKSDGTRVFKSNDFGL